MAHTDELCEEIDRADDWNEWPNGGGVRLMRCAVYWKTGTILICFRGAASGGRCQHLWLSESDALYFEGPAKEALNHFKNSESKIAHAQRERARQDQAKTLVDNLLGQIASKRRGKRKKTM